LREQGLVAIGRLVSLTQRTASSLTVPLPFCGVCARRAEQRAEHRGRADERRRGWTEEQTRGQIGSRRRGSALQPGRARVLGAVGLPLVGWLREVVRPACAVGFTTCSGRWVRNLILSGVFTLPTAFPQGRFLPHNSFLSGFLTTKFEDVKLGSIFFLLVLLCYTGKAELRPPFSFFYFLLGTSSVTELHSQPQPVLCFNLGNPAKSAGLEVPARVSRPQRKFDNLLDDSSSIPC
jgi:hypothetical protein